MDESKLESFKNNSKFSEHFLSNVNEQSDENVKNSRANSMTDLNSVVKLANITIRGHSMISLTIDGKERVCLAQISNNLLKKYSYNEIHNRRVALGINCIQCTPVQLELLRNAGAMPISSRRCGMITRREAERLIKSFLDKNKPPNLPEKFSFDIQHKCGYGCCGIFFPSRYNSSRAKCIQCVYCNLFFSPNKFIFHCHKTPNSVYLQASNVNFNSWRRHITLVNLNNDEQLASAWEDVKSIFNSGKRKRTPNSPQNSDLESCINFYGDDDDDENDEDEFHNEEPSKCVKSTCQANKNLNKSLAENSQKMFEGTITNGSTDFSFLNLMNPMYPNSFQMLNLFPDLFQKVLINETNKCKIPFLNQSSYFPLLFSKNSNNQCNMHDAKASDQISQDEKQFKKEKSTKTLQIETNLDYNPTSNFHDSEAIVHKKKNFVSILEHLDK